LTKCKNKYIIKRGSENINLAEKIISYIKNEADKEVVRKAKAKEQDILGYIIDCVYKKQKKRRKYMGR